jgi:prepilin-type N-terminal cleavage/methylation domain-containing protein
MGTHSEAEGYRGQVRSRFGALSRGGGFTLIELLVVIGIIAILAAIVIPVYNRATEKGRQATCMSNMHTIALAIKMYQMDYKVYPQAYDPVTGYGGVTSLYLEDYMTNMKSLRCPDDSTDLDQYIALYRDLAADPDAFDTLWATSRYFLEHYSSYNTDHTAITIVGGAPDGPYQLYDRNGYANPGTAGGYGLSLLAPPATFGIKYPGLCNKWAPDETVVSHCPYHRDFFGGEAGWQDVVVRVGGDATMFQVASYDWVNQPPQ